MTRVINRLNTARSMENVQTDQDLSVRWVTGQPPTAAPVAERIEILPRILQEGDPLPFCRRLVVLVPDLAVDLNELAQKIWNLAAPEHHEVFLLTVPENPDDKYNARQSISTLAAAIRVEDLPVLIQVDSGGSYLKAVKAIARPGDVLVCYSEMVSSEIEKKQKFVEILASVTQLPVYALNGALPRRKAALSSRLVEFLMIVACLATIIAFFGIQVWLDRNLVGVSKPLLEIISVLVEIRLIWFVADLHF